MPGSALWQPAVNLRGDGTVPRPRPAAFRQLTPKVLICTDGYRYGGREFGRRDESARIAAGLPGLEHVIYLPLLYPEDPRPPAKGAPPAVPGPPDRSGMEKRGLRSHN